MKSNIFILLFFGILLVGCNNKDDILSNKSPITQTNQSVHVDAVDNTANVIHNNNLGISQKNGLITIDTNKTKEFLTNIANKLQTTVIGAKSTIKHNKANSIEEAGISISRDKITIDLNKTKKFINKWGGTMEEILGEFDKTIKEVEKSLPSDF